MTDNHSGPDAATDPDGFTVPDVAEPFTAYRVWTVHDDHLVSPTVGHIWEPGALEAATCRSGGLGFFGLMSAFTMKLDVRTGRITREEGPPPCTACPSPISTSRARSHVGEGCGIYAYRSIDKLIEKGTAAYELHHSIVGEVAISGQVYEYEHGYRAQHATITALYRMPGQPADIVERAARRYGVPVRPFPAAGAKEITRAIRDEADNAPHCNDLWPSQTKRLRRRARFRRWWPIAYTALIVFQGVLHAMNPTAFGGAAGWWLAAAFYLLMVVIPAWKKERRNG